MDLKMKNLNAAKNLNEANLNPIYEEDSDLFMDSMELLDDEQSYLERLRQKIKTQGHLQVSTEVA